jgi:hypothetical protein
MTATEGDADGDPPFSLLLRLSDLPLLLQAELLPLQGPRDLASLAGANRACAAAVAATALMRWAKVVKTLVPQAWQSLCFNRAERLRWRDACSLAAFTGHLEVLKWLHRTGRSWKSATCDAAAVGGHLEMLIWLHNAGCPWDSLTCVAAAKGGPLEVLKWLHNAGCPWDTLTCEAGRCGRTPGDAEVAAQPGLPVACKQCSCTRQ